jgi:uncharacterized protein YecE (DUF72 family)
MTLQDLPRMFVGTSGFSYKEWKGSFYPRRHEGCRDARILRGAVRHGGAEQHVLPLPAEQTLRQWAEQVPAGFRFALKASRTITHI